MREKYENTNLNHHPLGTAFMANRPPNSTATWYWNSRAPLDFGASVRQIRESGNSIQYNNVVTNVLLLDHSNGDATRTGDFAGQSWTAREGHVHLSASVRGDHLSIGTSAPVSAQASAAFVLGPSTRLQFGWGQYVQYQELALLTSPLGGRGLLPTRSNQAIAAIEQRLGARSRLRLEFYNRADRDLAFQPLDYPRLLWPSLKIFGVPTNPPYVNSERGYSRGAEIFLAAQQRQPLHRMGLLRLRPHPDERRRDALPLSLGLRPAPHREYLWRLSHQAHRESQRALQVTAADSRFPAT